MIHINTSGKKGLTVSCKKARECVRDLTVNDRPDGINIRLIEIYTSARAPKFSINLGARGEAYSNFHTEGPEILGAIAQNLVLQTTWSKGSVLSRVKEG